MASTSRLDTRKDSLAGMVSMAALQDPTIGCRHKEGVAQIGVNITADDKEKLQDAMCTIPP